MTEGMLDISVIICAYTEERWDDLVAAVESVRRQSISPCEIIVVIDHNISLYERARSILPGVVVIENSEPRGVCGARNSGIAVAQGNLLAFLDDDAVAEADWLQQLSACCKDSQVLGVGGLVEPLWSKERPAWLPKEFYWVIGCFYQDVPKTPIAVRNTFIGCTCIPREVFETIGGFRNGLGPVSGSLMRCDETEMCIRAAQYWPQKTFLFEPQARIYHRVPPYRASWRYFCSRCYFEGFSKATVARYVGSKDSLSSERTYTLRVLPRGVLQGIKDALFHRDMTGLLRAGAIVAGFITTVAGYFVGSATLCLFVHHRVVMNTSHPLKRHGASIDRELHGRQKYDPCQSILLDMETNESSSLTDSKM